MPADSTTAERFAHLEDVRAQLPGLTPADRARAFCGAAGDEAVVCMRADLTQPVHEQWATLLTIGLDTRAGALDYVAGNPDAAARVGFDRF